MVSNMSTGFSWDNEFGELRALLAGAHEPATLGAHVWAWVQRCHAHDVVRYESEALPYLEAHWSRQPGLMTLPFVYTSDAKSHELLLDVVRLVPFMPLRLELATQEYGSLSRVTRIIERVGSLEFAPGHVSNDDTAGFIAQGRWMGLHVLNLTSNMSSEARMWQALVEHDAMPELRELTWYHINPPFDMFRRLIARPSLRGMERLNLSWRFGGLDSGELKALVHSPVGGELKALSLLHGVNRPKALKPLFMGFEPLHRLIELDLSGSTFNAEVAERLARTSYASRLKSLSLRHCEIGDEAMNALAMGKWKALEMLSLSGNVISSQAWCAFLRTQALLRLRVVELSLHGKNDKIFDVLCDQDVLPCMERIVCHESNAAPLMWMKKVMQVRGWHLSDSGFVRAT